MSLSREAISSPLPKDRRSAPRVRTIWRLAKLTTGGDSGLCRCLDLSDGGALIETQLIVDVGTGLRLELADSIVLNGVVVWRTASRMGVRFHEPVNSLDIVRRLSEERRLGKDRPLRLAVDARVEVVTGAGSEFLPMLNISQSGARLRDRFKLKVGTPLSLRLQDDLKVSGVVCWSRGDEVGVAFQAMIPSSLLGSARAFAPPEARIA